MSRLSLCFTAPYRVAVEESSLPPLPDGKVLVKTLVSAISQGTELLVYRGQAPTDLSMDETIPALGGEFGFPMKYGYAAVGEVVQLGQGVDARWRDALVFSFHSHESHFLSTPDELLPVPSGIAPEEAAMLPNMETAISLLMDGRPIIGEQVAVFGQGVVGLLTTALLARMPLGSLVTADRYPSRRGVSVDLGANASLDPADPDAVRTMTSLFHGGDEYNGADLAYELSGNPEALDMALAVTGYYGRIIIGSWYGSKESRLHLGGRFHRSRIQLVSSQVSAIAPELSGRWTKHRRLDLAWSMLCLVRPSHLITHRFPIGEAAQAYEMLDQRPDEAIQVLITYED